MRLMVEMCCIGIFSFQVCFSVCCSFTWHAHFVIPIWFTTALMNIHRLQWRVADVFWWLSCDSFFPGWVVGCLSVKLILRRLKPGSRQQRLTSLNFTRMCPKVPLCFLKRSCVATPGELQISPFIEFTEFGWICADAASFSARPSRILT